MPIKRKSSINKKYYESIGQGLLFGHDNIHFKTVNLPKKQRLVNLCKNFSFWVEQYFKPNFCKFIESPIRGQKGNKEYLYYFGGL